MAQRMPARKIYSDEDRQRTAQRINERLNGSLNGSTVWIVEPFKFSKSL